MDLVSTKLAFARDARQLLVIHDDHIAWHATSGDSRVLPIAGVRAIAAFGDQLWTVGSRVLERWSFHGRRLGAPRALESDAILAPAFAGPAAAACGGRIWLEDSAALRDVEIAEGALPFLGLRAFTLDRVRDARLVRLGAATWQLPRGAALVGAAAMFDGAGVALFVDRGDQLEAWSSTAAGEVRHRIPLPPGRIRLAARRGLAAIHHGDEVTAIDLRYGRTLGIGVATGDDLAIDPAGTFLATLHGGEVRITTLVDAFAEHDHRRSKQMGDLEQIAEDTDSLRTLGEDALDGLGLPGAGLMGMINNGVDMAVDIGQGNFLGAASDAAGIVGGGFDFAKEIGVNTGEAGNIVSAAKGGLDFIKGGTEISQDDYDGKGCDGVHDMLEGAGGMAEGIGGLAKNTPVGPWLEAGGKGLQLGLHAGDAIAPYVYGDSEHEGTHMESAPPDGIYKPTTGNSVVDYLFGID